MQQIRILINGAGGKMGTLACRVLDEASFDIVAKLGRADTLADTLQTLKPDVVLDVTCADSVMQNAKTIIAAGCRPVIGTSGLSKADVDTLAALAEKQAIGGLIIPNFSLGAVLMMHCAGLLARHFPRAEIIEKHHDQKKDAPSATSIHTAEIIRAARENQAIVCQETVPGALGANIHGVPVHAIRLPGLLAHQEVIFGGMGETLTLKHDSFSRDCFATGIVLACKEVMTLDSLVYGLAAILAPV